MADRIFFNNLKQLRRRRPIRYYFLTSLLTLTLITGCAVLVFVSGGTRASFPHLLYVPIAIAAYFLGLPGGVAAALIAGLAMGPAMPLDSETGEMQQTLNWVNRLGFYLLTGVVFGTTAGKLSQREQRLEAANRALRLSQANTLKAFSSVVETHDEATGDHCERVALNAKAVGEELGLSEVEQNQLYWAGIMHDCGKVAVPTSILNKPGALSEEEYEAIKLHPVFGANLLRSIGRSFEPVAVGVEAHHEQWDGRGYPHGLKDETIPLFGRILAIVDSFEAMTADRPYKSALDPEAALFELKRCSASKYDPRLVTLFEELFRSGRIQVGSPDSAIRLPGKKMAPWLTQGDY